MKKSLHLSLVLFSLLLVGGCATILPGNDPLVVETERVLTIGQGTFELVTTIDDANRSFWKTNAPPFHEFVEWLRTKITLNETNIVRRGPGMLQSLNNVKIEYKQHKASSNAVYTVLATVQSALNEAQTWLATVNTNTIPR